MNARDRYEPPVVETMTAQAILELLGPAQGLASGVSSDPYMSGDFASPLPPARRLNR